ncbi:MAG: c-type cytochrome [Cyclobacteriaceae bacterium]|nr:c-type cytochrome [Cyclobacteriaceae bacterium]
MLTPAILIGAGQQTFAQSGEGAMGTNELLLIVILGMVLLVSVLVLVVALYMVQIIKTIIADDKKQKALAAGLTTEEVEAEKGPSVLDQLMKKLTRSVPVEKSETVMLDHNYDGIRELDNHLPPWWKWLFYITIIWSVLYLLVYHVFNTLPLQHEEFNREMAKAEEARASRMQVAEADIDESNVEFTEVASHLENGRKIFVRDCAACHKPDGGGLIGPNLTDEYWIHGGSINDIFSVIKYGVPQKGMIPWQTKLNPTEIRDVSSYIVTLVGTNPDNAKGPEGEKYVPEEVESSEEEEEENDDLASN